MVEQEGITVEGDWSLPVVRSRGKVKRGNSLQPRWSRAFKEQGNEMLPKAKGVKLDFTTLAEKMTHRKERLLSDGVPAVGEDAMVKSSRGKGDSPAKAAKRKPPRVTQQRKR